MRSLRDCFVDSVARHGERKAITFLRQGHAESEISYIELDRDSSRMANTLLDLGVAKGDRVILFFPKSVIFVVAHFALQKIGAIAVPLNPGFKPSEMEYFIDDARPQLVLLGPEHQAMIEEINPNLSILVIDTQRSYHTLDLFKSASDHLTPVGIGLDDPAIIIYTSGTTGRPKGAVLTQGNLVHDAKNVIRVWEIAESDVLCHALPLFHVHGLCFALHTSLMAGSHVIMLDQFSPHTVLGVLSKKEVEQACTVFMAVPSMYAKLLDHLGDKKPDFEHMRLWTSGSAPLLPKDFERLSRALGKEPVEREGMSETGMNFSNPLGGVRKPGSIGLPLPDLQVRIVDPVTLQDVQAGQTGEIWLKGPAVTPGYWQKPEETAKTFENGWFRTGDLGNVDEEGYYYLTDRIKHIIISGGENISPKEVESVINQIEEVVESSVVGIPDQKWGEKVVAAVVLKPGAHIDPAQIQEFCRQHLHDWKCPKELAFPEKLPKNAMGKVLKEEVTKLFER
jgi:malonyl-CoA/methylmalonyl-CoA synthetase